MNNFILMICTGKQRRPRSCGKVKLNDYNNFVFTERQSAMMGGASEYWVVEAFDAEDASQALDDPNQSHKIKVTGGYRHVGTPTIRMPHNEPNWGF